LLDDLFAPLGERCRSPTGRAGDHFFDGKRLRSRRNCQDTLRGPRRARRRGLPGELIVLGTVAAHLVLRALGYGQNPREDRGGEIRVEAGVGGRTGLHYDRMCPDFLLLSGGEAHDRGEAGLAAAQIGVRRSDDDVHDALARRDRLFSVGGANVDGHDAVLSAGLGRDVDMDAGLFSHGGFRRLQDRLRRRIADRGLRGDRRDGQYQRGAEGEGDELETATGQKGHGLEPTVN